MARIVIPGGGRNLVPYTLATRSKPSAKQRTSHKRESKLLLEPSYAQRGEDGFRDPSGGERPCKGRTCAGMTDRSA